MRPIPSPATNGMRQPHASNASAGMIAASAAPTPEPSNKPTTAPTLAKPPMKPRRPSGARSIKNTIELGYSPPSESPCIMRRSVSAMGANTPMVSYAGSTPIRNVGTAMAVIEATSAVRLPK